MDGWARAPTRRARQIRGGRLILRSSRLRLCALRGGLGKTRTNLPAECPPRMPAFVLAWWRSFCMPRLCLRCKASIFFPRPASCPQSTHHAHDRSSSSCFNEMCRRLQIEERVKTACNGSKPTSSNKILKQNSTPLPV